MFANYAPGDEDKYVDVKEEIAKMEKQMAAQQQPQTTQAVNNIANAGEQPLEQAAF